MSVAVIALNRLHTYLQESFSSSETGKANPDVTDVPVSKFRFKREIDSSHYITAFGPKKLVSQSLRLTSFFIF